MNALRTGLPGRSCVDRLAQSFFSAVHGRGIVRVQGPIQLGEFSEPQPDVAILRFRSDFYADHHPMPPDVGDTMTPLAFPDIALDVAVILG